MSTLCSNGCGRKAVCGCAAVKRKSVCRTAPRWTKKKGHDLCDRCWRAMLNRERKVKEDSCA